MIIREGGPADAGTVLALFDEAIAWLVERGQTGPVGLDAVLGRSTRGSPRRPNGRRQAGCGSREPATCRSARSCSARGRSTSPPPPEPERYITALVTSRAHAGQDIGAELVRRAIKETRTAGPRLLRVDCWAGAPGLVAWYERQGFRRSGTFTVRDWHGQVFSMELP